ncbi:hypothetical protein Catovirus_1_837 [Catovirus CTV1]|uniref:Uncharacterized protein n=1 Tax=Catovirus CTV1 TaxID=1977631 RepID=A0A1V0SAP7_9VIRU|nr:hypothetical protein Catovirus_1_837 [Catovirus CTV1]
MEIDIFDNNNMIQKFCEKFGISEEKNYVDIFTEYFKKNYQMTQQFSENGKIVRIEIEKLNIGDNVIIKYLPYSQKYINYYDTKDVKGKVFFLDDINGLLYYDIKKNNEITRVINSIEKEYCSYYGDTSGYCMDIYKIYV